MTEYLFLGDSYRRNAPATVIGHTQEGGIILDRSIFYPTGGGQPGDSGRIDWNGRSMRIATAVKAGQGAIALVPAEPHALPAVDTVLQQSIDWERRHRHMRVHTALHLLSVVLPLPVMGGQIAIERGRLDFLMPESPEDRAALEEAINDVIERDYLVTDEWITEAALDANPGMVKMMSVQPPRGVGQIRLIRIGDADRQIDLQPCGGTHVARTAEIGGVRIGRIENKGKQNRRVHVHLD